MLLSNSSVEIFSISALENGSLFTKIRLTNLLISRIAYQPPGWIKQKFVVIMKIGRSCASAAFHRSLSPWLTSKWSFGRSHIKSYNLEIGCCWRGWSWYDVQEQRHSASLDRSRDTACGGSSGESSKKFTWTYVQFEVQLLKGVHFIVISWR